MNRQALAALAVSVVTGGVVGLVWPTTTLGAEPVSELGAVGDRVAAAVADFRAGDHLHVAPDARDRLTPREEADLEELLAASDPAVFVALWTDDAQAGYHLELDAVRQLMDGTGTDGVYVIWNGPGEGVSASRGGRGAYLGPEHFSGDETARLPEIVEAVEAEGLRHEEPYDAWGGRGGAAALGVLFGLGGALVLSPVGVFAGRALGRRRRELRQTEEHV